MTRHLLFLSLSIVAALFACDQNSDEPSDGSVSATIGAAGGEVETKGFLLRVPAGALDTDQTLTIKPRSVPSGYQARSAVFEMGPDGLEFLQPVTVVLDFQGDAKELVVFHSKLGSPGFDGLSGAIEGSRITVDIDHFSTIFAGHESGGNPGTGGSGGGDPGAGGTGGEEPGTGGGGGNEPGTGGAGGSDERPEPDFDGWEEWEIELHESIVAFKPTASIFSEAHFPHQFTLRLGEVTSMCEEKRQGRATLTCNFWPIEPTGPISPGTYEMFFGTGSSSPDNPDNRRVQCFFMFFTSMTGSASQGTMVLSEATEGTLKGTVSVTFERANGDWLGAIEAPFEATYCEAAMNY